MSKPPCVHCGQRPMSCARGLCHVCYADRNIRLATPVSENYTRRDQPDHEPTMAELEALIAAQRPTMPTGAAAADKPHERIERIHVARRWRRK